MPQRVLTDTQIEDFRGIVWDYFHANHRDMPWRDDPSPYHVLVSELMLQQTQVSRVLPKYQEFIARFPGIEQLAMASLAEVLQVWSGLGYNRRAKFLYSAAHMIVHEYAGRIPHKLPELMRLPGVGRNTAGAVLAYAFNQPVVFIETNIRSVLFHHFFADRVDVDDRELLPLLEEVLDPEHPREWYWALMDYGAYLKRTQGNNISVSKHYVRQSKFEGSRRQVRGKLLKALVDQSYTQQELRESVADERTDSVIADLVREGFVYVRAGRVRLTGASKLP